MRNSLFIAIFCLSSHCILEALQQEKPIPTFLYKQYQQFIEQLDQKKSNLPLSEEAQDTLQKQAHNMIARLFPYASKNAIIEIQQRLSQLIPPQQIEDIIETEKKEQAEIAAHEGYSQEIEYIPEMIGEETVSPSIMNYIKMHGIAAKQRISNIIRSPQVIGTALNLIPIYFLCGEESVFSANFFPPFLFLATSYQLPGFLQEVILNSNVDSVRKVLDTHLFSINKTLGSQYFGRYTTVAAEYKHMTPLMLAAQLGRADVVKLLLDRGADIARQDDKGKTVIDYAYIKKDDTVAVRQGKLAILKLILEPKLQQAKIAHAKLKAKYNPVQRAANDAIEALHEAMYGRSGIGQAQDIATIVGSYLCPSYTSKQKID